MCSHPQNKILFFSAGIPNIFGTFATDAGYQNQTVPYITGAFSIELNRIAKGGLSGTPPQSVDDLVTFNASSCSSVYGASTTVQPASATVNYYIRAL